MSLRHRCPESVQPESGRNQDIPIRQVHLTDPWFMLVDDSVILVTFCPWCGEKLQVQKEASICRIVERWDGGPIYCFHALPCSKHSILNQ